MLFYQLAAQEVLAKLNTSLQGLTPAEAQQRLEKYGPNFFQTKTLIPHWKIFFEQFRSFIIYILFFAVLLSAVVREYTEAILILAILIANALIGYFQEINAIKSIQALKNFHIVETKVCRAGKWIKIDAKNLVPGDIIALEAGDKVPADCRILEFQNLKVEESVLTGESMPVSKNAQKITQEVIIAEQKNMLFTSTTITEGKAVAVVTHTGMKTEIGKISQMVLHTERTLTPLQARLEIFGKQISYVVLGICLVILLTQGYYDISRFGIRLEAFFAFFFIAISLAVAAVPESLPVVITINLSIGVQKMLKKKVLVRTLASVETLGSCDVICTDKTGTLTQNQMTVRKIWIWQQETQLFGIGYEIEGGQFFRPNPVEELLVEIGFFCNNSVLYKEKEEWIVTGNPTEAAFLVSARKGNIEEKKYVRKNEILFDSVRKKMSVWVENQQTKKNYLFTKGAPDQVLAICTHYLTNENQVEPLGESEKQLILSQINHYSQQALRVLAFAYKPIEQETDFQENNLIFVGLQALVDPPRPDVATAIKKTKKAGIRVIMITGDYKETAKAIGKEVGIEGEVLTGEELNRLNDSELERKLQQNYNIFARVVPEHKQRIVTALQKLGHIVAMTGDGINDAPALKKANIGVAVGSGTEIAKEASDLILLDNSFANIVNAIEEGRGIYDNIQKVIMNSLAINFSEVIAIFITVVLGWNLPLTALMLLFMNLVIDAVPALALALDPHNPNIMRRKPKPANEAILPKPIRNFLVSLALLAGLGMIYIFYDKGGLQPNMLDLARTHAFLFLAIASLIFIFQIRAYFGVPFFSNPWLWGLVAFNILLQVVILNIPFLRNIFHLVSPEMIDLQYVAYSSVILLVLSWIALKLHPIKQ
ncbi:MAG: cation-translocating P-type ATPase [Microscillaceae bacterium]|nr:cation-translocating P-type ATPase [Microscillaceae bacterium]MDW8460723.1 cation-translocating P-type ATPase [Cytophagales bacterium]